MCVCVPAVIHQIEITALESYFHLSWCNFRTNHVLKHRKVVNLCESSLMILLSTKKVSLLVKIEKIPLLNRKLKTKKIEKFDGNLLRIHGVLENLIMMFGCGWMKDQNRDNVWTGNHHFSNIIIIWFSSQSFSFFCLKKKTNHLSVKIGDFLLLSLYWKILASFPR